jgi:hypothetical protein
MLILHARVSGPADSQASPEKPLIAGRLFIGFNEATNFFGYFSYGKQQRNAPREQEHKIDKCGACEREPPYVGYKQLQREDVAYCNENEQNCEGNSRHVRTVR